MAVNILRGEVGNHKSQNELHSFSRGGENRRPEKRIDTHWTHIKHLDNMW